MLQGERVMKRNLFKVFLVLLLGIGGLGLTRGWFVLTSYRHVEDQKVDIKLTVDPDKVKEDAGKAQTKLKELTAKARSEGHKDEKQPADVVPPDRE